MTRMEPGTRSRSLTVALSLVLLLLAGAAPAATKLNGESPRAQVPAGFMLSGAGASFDVGSGSAYETDDKTTVQEVKVATAADAEQAKPDTKLNIR